MFEKVNTRLLDLAISETGFTEGDFGGILTTDSEINLMRVKLITVLILSPYYTDSKYRKDIDSFIKSFETIFNPDFGIYSMKGSYESWIEKIESLLNTMKSNN